MSPFQGFGREAALTDRALPYPDDYKAFSLNLIAMGLTRNPLIFDDFSGDPVSSAG